MSFEAERKKIETHLTTNWSMTDVPLLFDNTNQKQPKGDFVLFRIVGSEGRQAEIVGQGATLCRYIGLAQADVVVTQGSGHAKARQIADSVADIFRRQQIVDDAGGVITFKIPSVRPLGVIGDRFRIVVTLSYMRDIRE